MVGIICYPNLNRINVSVKKCWSPHVPVSSGGSAPCYNNHWEAGKACLCPPGLWFGFKSASDQILKGLGSTGMVEPIEIWIGLNIKCQILKYLFFNKGGILLKDKTEIILLFSAYIAGHLLLISWWLLYVCLAISLGKETDKKTQKINY